MSMNGKPIRIDGQILDHLITDLRPLEGEPEGDFFDVQVLSEPLIESPLWEWLDSIKVGLGYKPKGGTCLPERLQNAVHHYYIQHKPALGEGLDELKTWALYKEKERALTAKFIEENT